MGETLSIELSKAALINEALVDYLRLRDESVQSIEEIATNGTQVLSAWMSAKEKLLSENKTNSCLFNPFHTIGIGETTHSALVGNLLDPHGSHGQGRLFLESFLTLIGIPEPSAGKWVITVEQGRIDILLRRETPCSVVIIENKSNGAIDQKNQLYRYWHRFIHPQITGAANSKKQFFKVVYLTPTLSKEPVGDSLSRPQELDSTPNLPQRVPIELVCILTLERLVKNWLADANVNISQMNSRLATFLQFYAELWETL